MSKQRKESMSKRKWFKPVVKTHRRPNIVNCRCVIIPLGDGGLNNSTKAAIIRIPISALIDGKLKLPCFAGHISRKTGKQMILTIEFKEPYQSFKCSECGMLHEIIFYED